MNLFIKIFGFCSLFLLGRFLQTCSFPFHVIICLLIYRGFKGLKINQARYFSYEARDPWIEHPDICRVDWLNKIIKSTWPLLQTDVLSLLKDLSEKITKKYFTPGIELFLEQFGQRHPRIIGIKVLEVMDRNKIFIDVFLEHISDSILKVKLFTEWKIIKWTVVDLKRLDIKGTLRFEFELTNINGLPEISKIFLSTIEIPAIDISLGVISDLLLIDVVIEYFIDHFCQSYLKFPKKLELYNDASLSEMKPSLPLGVLSILIQEATKLPNKDRFGLLSDVSDPYAVLSLFVDSKPYRYQTQVIDDDLNPKWNYLCQVPIEDVNTISHATLTVMDKDLVTKDDHLGSCNIFSHEMMDTVRTHRLYEFWRNLVCEEKQGGKVKISMTFSKLLSKRSSLNMTEGLLSIYIDSCQNLSLLENRHPYWKLKVMVGKDVSMSRNIQMSSHPIYCEKFVFYVKNPTVDTLKIDLINLKNNKNGGSFTRKVSQLDNSDWSLSNLHVEDLVSQTPAGQTQDPKILLSCEYSSIHHTQKTLHTMESIAPKQKEVKNMRKIAENKLDSLFLSSKRKSKEDNDTCCLLDISILYQSQISKLFIMIHSLKRTNLFFSNFSNKLLLKIRKKNTRIKIDLNTENISQNELKIDRKLEYKLEKTSVNQSKLEVKIL